MKAELIRINTAGLLQMLLQSLPVGHDKSLLEAEDLLRQLAEGQDLNLFQQFPEEHKMSRSSLQSHHSLAQAHPMSPIPVREDDGFNQTQNFANHTQQFHRQEFKQATTSQSLISQSVPLKPQVTEVDFLHKQQALKEPCELPFVPLTEEDAKKLFDCSVHLLYGDFNTV